MEVNGVGGPIEKVTQPTLQTSPTLYNTHNASEDLEPIIEILLIIGKPESHLLQLLDLICENFPPYVTEREIRDYVKVACPCQEVHDV